MFSLPILQYLPTSIAFVCLMDLRAYYSDYNLYLYYYCAIHVAVPGIPRDVRAVETAESTESDCIIVVTWDPPANTTDVDHYIVSVPSRNISENNKLLTTDPLRVRNCHNNISIHVAAVNHLGCEGQADVLASLLGTESAPNEPTTTTTNGPNNEGGSTISSK